ncbi:MAG: hypothetical protein QMD02_00765 [Bacteroidales bacterium]|nr:hypothetical protein [Bacteroidales bacterium]
MKLLLFTLLILLISNHFIFSQNEDPICDKVNCIGSCGKFLDKNADNICDFGIVISHTETINDEVIKDTVEKKQKSYNNEINNSNNTTHDNIINKQIMNYQNHFVSIPSLNLNIKKRPYNLLEIGIITLILYSFSWLFTKYHLISKRLHKRIWNVLLLISFIISCILGIILIIQINYGIWPALRLEFLYWHVQVGIVMTLVGLFHALWHINYFKKIFSRIQ